MAHAQNPYFVFRRNGRVHLNRHGRQFSRLLAAEVCASAVVMLDTRMFWGSVKGTGYPLHSPVSPSLPLPCVTVCHHISTGVYPRRVRGKFPLTATSVKWLSWAALNVSRYTSHYFINDPTWTIPLAYKTRDFELLSPGVIWLTLVASLFRRIYQTLRCTLFTGFTFADWITQNSSWNAGAIFKTCTTLTGEYGITFKQHLKKFRVCLSAGTSLIYCHNVFKFSWTSEKMSFFSNQHAYRTTENGRLSMRIVSLANFKKKISTALKTDLFYSLHRVFLKMFEHTRGLRFLHQNK